MEETVPILHSGFVRCNTYRSKNPYGAKVSHLRVIRHSVAITSTSAANDSARTGATRKTTVVTVIT